MDDYRLETDTGDGDSRAARATGQCAAYCRCDRSAAGWMAATLALVAAVAGLVAAVALKPTEPTPPVKRTINVGSLYQGFHQIEATAVQHLLDAVSEVVNAHEVAVRKCSEMEVRAAVLITTRTHLACLFSPDRSSLSR